MRYRLRHDRRLWGVLLGWALLALIVIGPVVAQVSVLNFFDQATGADNVLNINGTLEFEDKATVLDHGTATTNTSGVVAVTTNLSSITDCVLTLKKVGTPSDDPVFLSGIWTTGSGVLEIQAWKTNGSDPTLSASSVASSVGYLCAGAD